MKINKIFYGKHYIDKLDKKSVLKSLNSNFLTGGNLVNLFEKKFKNLLKCNYAVSCSNATAGLFLAFKAIDLKPGDIVIMPVINFISSYSMAKSLGAKIFLCDVDSLNGQIYANNIIDCIQKNKIKKIKAIVTMYLGGYVENNIDVYKLKKKLKCYLIEDSCHALGAKYTFKEKKYLLGSCQHSDLAIFSFHPVKSITTGEGGLVTTNSKQLSKKIQLLKNHGIIRNIKKYWDYDISNLGYNYRLSDINCALGLSQLKKLNQFITRRKKIYNYYYKNSLKFNDFLKIIKYNNKSSGYHLLLAKVNFGKLKSNKDELIKYFIKNKIFIHYHYKPIYKYSFYEEKLNLNNFVGSENFYKNTITLPLYYKLNFGQIDYFFKIFQKFINIKIK